MHELKSSVDEERVFFGIKECLRNSSKLDKAFLASDHRGEVKKLLEANKIKTEVLDSSKEEVTDRLGLRFQCEVFGIRK